MIKKVYYILSAVLWLCSNAYLYKSYTNKQAIKQLRLPQAMYVVKPVGVLSHLSYFYAPQLWHKGQQGHVPPALFIHHNLSQCISECIIKPDRLWWAITLSHYLCHCCQGATIKAGDSLLFGLASKIISTIYAFANTRFKLLLFFV